MEGLEYLRPLVLERLPAEGHAIIQASAGTGKTYVLEHLIIELLRTTAKSIEEILVVTFTERATAEMRVRIRQRIERLLHEAPQSGSPALAGHSLVRLDAAARERLAGALGAFERAPVFTIHAFCRRVLSEFAFHSGARFALELDDGRRSFRSAFRAELRERFAADELLRRALEHWLEDHSADELETLLYAAYRCRYQPAAHASAGVGLPPAGGAITPRAMIDLYLPAIAERLARDRRERGAIDYDDMLALVWQALEAPGGPALARALRQRYRIAMVDEFQDTDDLQWRIFRRLFVEGGEGHRLLVVGDEKQAIYAFRNADVHSFLRARTELRSAGAAPLALDTNFRSTASMIDAHNLIFDQTARPPLFDGAISYAPVKCGVPERRALDENGRAITPITLMRYRPPGGGKGSAQHARDQIGKFIAAAIKRMIDEPAGAITIAEPPHGGEAPERRKIRPSDIFVLAATKKECEEIGGHLREAGVPFAFYKLDGLLQGDEAGDVLAVLRALEDLTDRSRRRQAWLSPFFAMEYRDLAAAADPPPEDPRMRLLDEWRALAEDERFAELFDHMLYGSGLADRELFLRRGDRALANYLQIFELLLERAVAERLALTEIIERLEGYIGGRDQPPGPDGNIHRIESERAAVQVMTMHMSKGLEADVVLLFGGLYAGGQRPPLAVYHEGDDRRFAIGKEERAEAKQSIESEQREESQRLLYVALTRARAKLFLPLYQPNTIRALNGHYAQLNQRLLELVPSAAADRRSGRTTSMIEVVDASDAGELPAGAPGAMPIEQWVPPAELLEDRGEPERTFELLVRAHPPLRMNSYTSLKRESADWELMPADFKTDLAPAIESDDLPGDSNTGLFLHEVIERLDFESLAIAGGLDAWRRLEEVERLFHHAMSRHQVRDPRWFDRGTEMVYRTLSTPLRTASGIRIGTLGRCRGTREMEFVFPIPEASHPQPGGAGGARWIAERGYLKGFIDFVFEADGLIYFADWKSDLLRDYRPESVRQHVERNYQLQALIYSAGVVRLLRTRDEADYRRRFGGLLYVFLRGVGASDDPADGIYFHCPDWSEIRRNQDELMRIGGA